MGAISRELCWPVRRASLGMFAKAWGSPGEGAGQASLRMGTVSRSYRRKVAENDSPGRGPDRQKAKEPDSTWV